MTGAMAAFKSISGLDYSILCKCDQTGEVVDVAKPWEVQIK